MSDESFAFEYDEIAHKTEKALLVRLDAQDDDEDCIWIPKSQVLSRSEYSMRIPLWLAKEKELV